MRVVRAGRRWTNGDSGVQFLRPKGLARSPGRFTVLLYGLACRTDETRSKDTANGARVAGCGAERMGLRKARHRKRGIEGPGGLG